MNKAGLSLSVKSKNKIENQQLQMAYEQLHFSLCTREDQPQMALNSVHLKTKEQSHRVSQNRFWKENGVLLLLSHLVSGLE